MRSQSSAFAHWSRLLFAAVLLLSIAQPRFCTASVHTGRSLLQGQGPSPYASLGPDSSFQGLAVDAVLDLWGVSLLPFALNMQMALLVVLNETILDADQDELQLLAVEEILPLSGPSAVSVNNRNAQNGNGGPTATGRRMLSGLGPKRSLLEVLAQSGNSSNLAELPHLELRVRIASAPGQVDLIRQETIDAVNGPVLPKLQDRGVNASFLQLTSLGTEFGNQGNLGPGPNPRLSDGAVGGIVAAAVVVCMSAAAIGFFVLRRRRNKQQEKDLLVKDETPSSLTSVQADSHAPLSSMDGAIDVHSLSSMLPPGARVASQYSHSNSTVSSVTSADKEAELQAAGVFGVPFSELQFSRVIGEGSFGRVYLGKWRETAVAIKILNAPDGPLQDDSWDLTDQAQLRDASWSQNQLAVSASRKLLAEELSKEAALVAGLRHPNIVMFLGVSLNPPCMVTEFCARGSLMDVLYRARTNKAVAMELDWRRRLRLLLDAAKGMLYLHSRQPPVLHRDLKSANLLVDKHWQVKVADFNLSRVMQPSAAVSSLAATNPRWLPPEVLSGGLYDSSADVYAFGIVMWELITWRVPWEGDTPWQVVISVVDHHQRPAVPEVSELPAGLPAASPKYLELMQQCWDTLPERRPGFEAVIGHLRDIIDAEDASAMAAGSNGVTSISDGSSATQASKPPAST